MIQLFIYIFKRKKKGIRIVHKQDYETFNLVSHSWGAQY